ncbi:MAG TPA: MarR family transcriptional regulator [Ktedonobacterales bacterium]|jgi:DNA-binding MarR family transcriptional regulator
MDPISDDTIPAAIRTALAAQRAVFRALHRDHMPDWAHLELSMGQLKTLMIVATRQPTNVSGLAEALALSKPTASMLVDRLVQLGFVARTEDPDDRRRTLVTPTPEGAALVLRLRQGSVDRLVRWLGALEPDDLAALTRGLEALAAAAEHDTPTSARPGAPSAAPSPRGVGAFGERPEGPGGEDPIPLPTLSTR